MLPHGPQASYGKIHRHILLLITVACVGFGQVLADQVAAPPLITPTTACKQVSKDGVCVDSCPGSCAVAASQDGSPQVCDCPCSEIPGCEAQTTAAPILDGTGGIATTPPILDGTGGYVTKEPPPIVDGTGGVPPTAVGMCEFFTPMGSSCSVPNVKMVCCDLFKCMNNKPGGHPEEQCGQEMVAANITMAELTDLAVLAEECPGLDAAFKDDQSKYCQACDFGGKFTVELETMSGGVAYSGSNTGAKASFMINGAYTEPVVLFEKVGTPGAGSSDGEVATTEMPMTAWPTKFKIIAGGNDALGYSRIDFVLPSGAKIPILKVDPNVDLRYPDKPTDPSMKYWVDGNEQASDANEFVVPALTTVPGVCSQAPTTRGNEPPPPITTTAPIMDGSGGYVTTPPILDGTRGIKDDCKPTPCIFPFKYYGQTYNECSDVGASGVGKSGYAWCPTEVDFSGSYVDATGAYMTCEGCSPQSEVPTKPPIMDGTGGYVTPTIATPPPPTPPTEPAASTPSPPSAPPTVAPPTPPDWHPPAPGEVVPATPTTTGIPGVPITPESTTFAVGPPISASTEPTGAPTAAEEELPTPMPPEAVGMCEFVSPMGSSCSVPNVKTVCCDFFKCINNGAIGNHPEVQCGQEMAAAGVTMEQLADQATMAKKCPGLDAAFKDDQSKYCQAPTKPPIMDGTGGYVTTPPIVDGTGGVPPTAVGTCKFVSSAGGSCSVPNVKIVCCDFFKCMNSKVGSSGRHPEEQCEQEMVAAGVTMEHLRDPSTLANKCPGLDAAFKDDQSKYCQAPTTTPPILDGMGGIATTPPILDGTGGYATTPPILDIPPPAVGTCNFEALGGVPCSVPNVKIVCCDFFKCTSNKPIDQCMQEMTAVGATREQLADPATMAAKCPGLSAAFTDAPGKYCKVPTKPPIMDGTGGISTPPPTQPSTTPVVPAGPGVPIADSRVCDGHEKKWSVCENLPPCNVCIGVDCSWNQWTAWTDVGGCSGLRVRTREINSTSNECGQPCSGAKVETAPNYKVLPPACTPTKKDCVISGWTISNITGQVFKERRIIELPQYGGKECPKQLRITWPDPNGGCKDNDCKEDCVWGDWSSWTACSKRCNGGVTAKFRRVHKHAKNGGHPCTNYSQVIKPCNEQACHSKTVCKLAAWSDWTCCEEGHEQKYRTRHVIPPPGRVVTVGEMSSYSSRLRDVLMCNETTIKETVPCPKYNSDPCKVSDWTQWSACPVSCDGGQQFRLRHLLDPGKSECPKIALKDTAPCAENACDVERDCTFGAWETWGDCSLTCGSGVMTRKRVVAQLASPLGRGCRGNTQMANTCSLGPCQSTDCRWGNWHDWSACSATCGGGTKRRFRHVDVAPTGGGKLCPVQPSSQMTSCNLQECGGCIDGAWMQWSSWGACSATCGDGFITRHRDVQTHPNNCGDALSGSEDAFQKCSNKPCLPDIDCQLGAWTQWGACSRTCAGLRERTRVIAVAAENNGLPCGLSSLRQMEECNPTVGESAPLGCGNEPPQPCAFSAWTTWGTCSASCEGGQKTRDRHITTPSSNGGKACEAALEETIECGIDPCPGKPPRDCEYGPWGDWSGCTKCGGQKYRQRQITQTATKGGKICNLTAVKEVDDCPSHCHTHMYCAWTDWSLPGTCSATCGPATKIRQRTLNQFLEEPTDYLFMGALSVACGGTQNEAIVCDTDPCSDCSPVDAEFSAWSQWSGPSCLSLCERHRTIAMYAKCGGSIADGALLETKFCESDCTEPEDCQWGQWTEWTAKSMNAGCGPSDQVFRSRLIIKRAVGKGKACVGLANMTKPCGDPSPPNNCTLNPWAEWTDCTASCGKGFKRRSRHYSPAENAGLGCNDALEELHTCDTFDIACHCNLTICPFNADCEMSQWTDWAVDPTQHTNPQCYRSREVTREAVGNGTACNAVLKSTKTCKTVVDCEVTEWSDWDHCSKTCDRGQQVRHRAIHTNPQAGGLECPKVLILTRGCNEIPCHKPQCEWGGWADWSDCPATCGGGLQKRTRDMINDDGCEGDISEVRMCANQSCPYKDCVLGDWKEWGECTVPCGGGTKMRHRDIVQLPEPGGMPCPEADKCHVVGCNTLPCGDKCVDGIWGDWSTWQPCSRTCEGGYTWRSRVPAQMANECGTPLSGMAREEVECNAQVGCDVGQDCVFDDWSAWTTCSRNCSGQKERSRGILTPAANNGLVCKGVTSQVAPCNPGKGEEPPLGCVPPVRDCVPGAWGDWGACSPTCGHGIKIRSRNVTEPSTDGTPCEADLKEIASCFEVECPSLCEKQDCQWGAWTEWGACDKCGGEKRRYRDIAKLPTCGGAACTPEAAGEIISCDRQCGPEVFYCSWTHWSSWSSCDATCGMARRYQMRHLRLLKQQVKAPLIAGNVRVLDDFYELDKQQIEDKLMELREKSRGIDTRNFQELFVAFTCGGVTVVLGLLLHRIWTKSNGPAIASFAVSNDFQSPLHASSALLEPAASEIE